MISPQRRSKAFHSDTNSHLGVIRAVPATSGGCAVFLGNKDKVFVMLVDQSVGAAIAMFMQGTKKERPLTHILVANILRALGAKIERVIINDLNSATYFARLVLSAEKESQQKKIIEIDARPSDSGARKSRFRSVIGFWIDAQSGEVSNGISPKHRTFALGRTLPA